MLNRTMNVLLNPAVHFVLFWVGVVVFCNLYEPEKQDNKEELLRVLYYASPDNPKVLLSTNGKPNIILP